MSPRRLECPPPSEIVSRTFLLDVGRRKIDGDPFGRKRVAVVLSADAVFLPDRAFGQADRGKLGQAAGEVDLHFDPQHDPVERRAVDLTSINPVESRRTSANGGANNNGSGR